MLHAQPPDSGALPLPTLLGLVLGQEGLSLKVCFLLPVSPPTPSPTFPLLAFGRIAQPEMYKTLANF